MKECKNRLNTYYSSFCAHIQYLSASTVLSVLTFIGETVKLVIISGVYEEEIHLYHVSSTLLLFYFRLKAVDSSFDKLYSMIF